MNGYNFTDRVRKVLQMAREEAARLHHEFVGTEHILLGIVREGEGVACAVLTNLNADLEDIRDQVERTVKEGKAANLGPASQDLPYTSRAKKILELSMSEARELNHAYVGTEHLLLGVLREEKGIGAQVLLNLGLTLERVRAETLHLLAEPPAEAASPDLHVRIDDASDQSITDQIVAQIQEAVATGRLNPGVRLPPVRRLADQLDIAPGTVARAYGELERRGVVVTDGARGTRVAERPPSPMPTEQRPQSLVGLLRPVAVAAYHLGATAEELRRALEEAMRGIFGGTKPKGTDATG